MTSQGNSISGGAVFAGTVVAAVLLLGGALMPALARAGTGSVTGTVVDAVDKAPVEGAEVCAWNLADEELFECVETDAFGVYAVAGLEPGEYGVEFWRYGYRGQYYDGKSEWSEADPVLVGAAAVTGINAELARAPGIRGRVTALEGGGPVEEVEVCAENTAEEFAGCDWTGADGTYSIGFLEAGTYKVHFWPGDAPGNLALQYYNGRGLFAEADPVVLAEDEVREGIDAVLGPGGLITGNVSSNATGLPLEEVRVCSADALSSRPLICTWTNAKGNYGLPHLAAGSYKVAFSTELGEWFPGYPLGSEDDGFPTLFWDSKTTLAAANPISLLTGGRASGISARLGPPAPLAPPRPITTVPPPVAKPSAAAPPKKCRRGFKKKVVHGKRRCVKVHRRHRHHRSARHPGAPKRPQSEYLVG